MNDTTRAAPVEAGDRKWKAVYTIVERNEVGKRPLFLRIGTAWPNRDQSMNVRLDAMPVNGLLHIRDYEPPPEGGYERRPRRDDTFGTHNPNSNTNQGAF